MKNPGDPEKAAANVLKNLVRLMVDNPDDVRVEISGVSDVINVEIYVHDDDKGKALGRRGSRARALETVFRAIYGKLGKRLTLKVIAPRSRR